MRTINDLRQMQALPLSIKVSLTKARIRQWVNEFGEDGVYISFSGGKDSTALLDIVRKMYPEIPAVFSNTGLEYPEIVDFVKGFDNVVIIRPSLNFKKVIEKHGYPLISKETSAIIGGAQKAIKILESEGVPIDNDEVVLKECSDRFKKLPGEWRHLAQCIGYVEKGGLFSLNRMSNSIHAGISKKYKSFLKAPFLLSDKCCYEMKKRPFHKYEKETGRKPMTAQMAAESKLREAQWLKSGCNAFDAKKKISNPMAFWNESDVLQYIKENNLPICSVYGEIVKCGDEYTTTKLKRTGCMFCAYGCQFKHFKQFEFLKENYPKQYDFIMKSKENGGMGYKDVLDWINANTELTVKY